jgi:hypothetical protein
MKGLLISVGIILALYAADQQFSQGKYTDVLQHMVTQIRHSFGVSGALQSPASSSSLLKNPLATMLSW